MTLTSPQIAVRQRAPSKRALATKTLVFNAAEKVFANQGYDGATIRDIADEAGLPVGTIHHHGGGKRLLFHQVVARRAEPLSEARMSALNGCDHPKLEDVIGAFFRPFVTIAEQDQGWRNYARLVAIVSADPRWRGIAAECFDPTANVFLDALQDALPGATRQQIAACFVYSVSALLALITSEERIKDLGNGGCILCDEVENLIRFCACGLTCCR